MELFFDENGFINLKLRNLEPYLTGTVHYTIIWDFSSDFKVTLKDFWLDAKIRITTKEKKPQESICQMLNSLVTLIWISLLNLM
jgi:hypothetical protein